MNAPNSVAPAAPENFHELRRLTETQALDFDEDYVRPHWFSLLSSDLESHFADGQQTLEIADLGGGNGKFTDRILERFPQARATVVDIASELLARNAPHPRKSVLQADVAEFERRFDAVRFDVVFFNWFLHHFISKSLGSSVDNQVRVLKVAARKLAPRGQIFVFENLYESRGGGDSSARMIFHLTSSRALAPVTSRFGANTAGTGVLFHSDRAWRRIFERAGLEVRSFHRFEPWPISLLRRVVLGIQGVRCGLYVLEPCR